MIRLANAQRRSPDAIVQIKDIFAQEKIPTKYLEQILLALKNAGLLNSKMGIGVVIIWQEDWSRSIWDRSSVCWTGHWRLSVA